MSSIDWSVALANLKEKVSSQDFESWFTSLYYKENNGYVATFVAPSQFIKGWILTNYKSMILGELQQQLPTIDDISIFVSSFCDEDGSSSSSAESSSASVANFGETAPTNLNFAKNNSAPNSYSSTKNTGAEEPFKPHEDDYLSNISSLSNPDAIRASLVPRYTFKNFVVGKPNEFPFALARKIATEPNSGINPLFIYGGVGLGKTHLMHSIAWHIIEDPNQNRQVIYLSAEKFVYLYVKSITSRNMMSFKEIFRTTDVLMIDDFQFIGGKDQSQEEFFHSFNTLIEQGKQIVFSADKPPSELDQVEQRIVSRLNAGVVANINATTYELRLGILEMNVKQMKAKVPREVLEYIAHNITSNIRELEGALRRIVQRQTLLNTKITLDVAVNELDDMLRSNAKRITLDNIQKVVAEHYAIRFSDMLSNKRHQGIVKAKHIAMYLAKHLTEHSFSDIGKKFGGKDHSTVLYAAKKVGQMRLTDPEIDRDINTLTRVLQCHI